MPIGDDRVVPFDLGQELASKIHNARFVPMDGNNHLFLENEPACAIFMQEVAKFLGDPAPPAMRTSATTPRLAKALSQAEQSPVYRILAMIAALLSILSFVVWMFAG